MEPDVTRADLSIQPVSHHPGFSYHPLSENLYESWHVDPCGPSALKVYSYFPLGRSQYGLTLGLAGP